MKKRVILSMLLALILVLTACGNKDKKTSNENTKGETTESSNKEPTKATVESSSTEPVASTGKELAVQIGPNPETLDPALNSAVDGGNMILHLYECLLVIDQDGKLAPGQAETWQISTDGLTWTFTLRDGLKWSNGEALTANDFVYSWKRICNPDVAAPYAETVLSMVKGYEEAVAGNIDALAVSAPDDKTFVVELVSPCSFFGSLAAFATLSPVNEATIEANGDAWAVAPETYISNGPFYMTEWVPGSHIKVEKNPNYWNADAVKLSSLKFVLMEDSNASYNAYQTGEVLLIKDVPTEEIPSLTGNEEFHVEPIIGTYYVSLNNSLEVFKDARVRKALSLAIDREYVATTLMQGTYTPAPNFMGPGWIDTDGSDFKSKANGGNPYIDIANFEANLAEAKRLLEEAGYKDGVGFPAITYSTNDTSYHKVVAEYLQQAWLELGITLDINIMEWASFTPTRRAGDYEAARNGWVGDYSDPSNMLDLFYSTNGNNDGKFNSAEFDAAMDIARTTLNPEERSEALHRAEDILMAEAACIPIAYYNDFWLQSGKITGSWHSAYGYWHFMYADVVE